MKTTILEFLAVGAGSSVGGMLRFGVGKFFGWLGFAGSAFPLGTMVINITGSFFLGWFLATATARPMSPIFNDYWRMAIAVGFVGAYTTFSTYMFESDNLFQAGTYFRAMLYLVGSLVIGLTAVRLGAILGQYMK